MSGGPFHNVGGEPLLEVRTSNTSGVQALLNNIDPDFPAKIAFRKAKAGYHHLILTHNIDTDLKDFDPITEEELSVKSLETSIALVGNNTISRGAALPLPRIMDSNTVLQESVQIISQALESISGGLRREDSLSLIVTSLNTIMSSIDCGGLNSQGKTAGINLCTKLLSLINGGGGASDVKYESRLCKVLCPQNANTGPPTTTQSKPRQSKSLHVYLVMPDRKMANISVVSEPGEDDEGPVSSGRSKAFEEGIRHDGGSVIKRQNIETSTISRASIKSYLSRLPAREKLDIIGTSPNDAYVLFQHVNVERVGQAIISAVKTWNSNEGQFSVNYQGVNFDAGKRGSPAVSVAERVAQLRAMMASHASSSANALQSLEHLAAIIGAALHFLLPAENVAAGAKFQQREGPAVSPDHDQPSAPLPGSRPFYDPTNNPVMKSDEEITSIEESLPQGSPGPRLLDYLHNPISDTVLSSLEARQALFLDKVFVNVVASHEGTTEWTKRAGKEGDEQNSDRYLDQTLSAPHIILIYLIREANAGRWVSPEAALAALHLAGLLIDRSEFHALTSLLCVLLTGKVIVRLKRSDGTVRSSQSIIKSFIKVTRIMKNPNALPFLLEMYPSDIVITERSYCITNFPTSWRNILSPFRAKEMPLIRVPQSFSTLMRSKRHPGTSSPVDSDDDAVEPDRRQQHVGRLSGTAVLEGPAPPARGQEIPPGTPQADGQQEVSSNQPLSTGGGPHPSLSQTGSYPLTTNMQQATQQYTMENIRAMAASVQQNIPAYLTQEHPPGVLPDSSHQSYTEGIAGSQSREGRDRGRGRRHGGRGRRGNQRGGMFGDQGMRSQSVDRVQYMHPGVQLNQVARNPMYGYNEQPFFPSQWANPGQFPHPGYGPFGGPNN